MDKFKIFVTFANRYSIEDGGRSVTGMTLNYFFWGEDGAQFRPVSDPSGGAVGYQRAKCSMDYDMRNKIQFVPGIYEASFAMAVGSDGKPVMKVVDLDFVGKAEVLLTE